MFGVTLIEHLRMTFGHVVRRHEAHLRLARSRARWSRTLRGLEALLLIGVAATSINAVSSGSARTEVATAALALAATMVLLVSLTFDFDRLSHAHAATAARLWSIRERYRSLLSDLADGALDADTVRRQRDALMEDVAAVYEAAPFDRGPQLDRAVADSSENATLTEREIDQFLPASLHKGGKPNAA